jgi:predicted DNA-binding transcriptional regulator AlpA
MKLKPTAPPAAPAPPRPLPFDKLADQTLLRVADIARSAKDPQRVTLLPISRATWHRFVKDGTAPAAVRLGKRTVAWRMGDLRAFIASKGGGLDRPPSAAPPGAELAVEQGTDRDVLLWEAWRPARHAKICMVCARWSRLINKVHKRSKSWKGSKHG